MRVNAMNENFVTLAGVGEGEYEEKNSVFIGYAAPINSEEEALEIIKSKKKEYYDARHNVWAYILPDGVTQRYSDDGEPQGTGGMPTLSVISKRGVCGACVVVTRYFGGTLLGAGGLVRAYTQAASSAMDAAGIKKFDRFTVIELKPSSDTPVSMPQSSPIAFTGENSRDFISTFEKLIISLLMMIY